MAAPTRLLILVHPGSCKGSAEFNIGPQDAAHFRKAIADELLAWGGGLLVINGGLEDEKEDRFQAFDDAIEHALDQARGRGDIGNDVMGPDMDDHNQVFMARAVLKRHKIAPGSAEITITGAWLDRDGENGCVNSVRDALLADGHLVSVSPSAVPVADDPMLVKARLEARYEKEDIFEFRDTENEGCLFKDGTPWAFCTNWAINICRFEGDRAVVYGFSADENPTSEVSKLADGHDFAVVDGRFIVDPWLTNVECMSKKHVFDLEDPNDAAEVAKFYGDRNRWTRSDELTPGAMVAR